jgi:hypothetical protein
MTPRIETGRLALMRFFLLSASMVKNFLFTTEAQRDRERKSQFENEVTTF